MLEEKIEKLKQELIKEKLNYEEKSKKRLTDYQLQAENRLKNFWNKSDGEFDNLAKRMSDQVNNYLSLVKGNLLEFNMRVQADSSDLVKLPKDVKQLDKSPLRQVQKKHQTSKSPIDRNYLSPNKTFSTNDNKTLKVGTLASTLNNGKK